MDIKTDIANNDKFVYRMIRRASIVAMIILLIITQTGCGDKEPVSKTEFALDTVCTVTVYDIDGKEAEELLDGVFEEIAGYEDMMSRTREGSDIYRINHAEGKPVEVSAETAEVISMGLDMSRLSGGRFDITVGRLAELWDFNSEDPEVPDADDIAEAVSSAGYEKVHVDGLTVRVDDPETHIDLGGIAKGYIADRVGEYIEENGSRSAVINLGGNVVTIGERPDGTPWNIGVERPYSDRDEIIGAVEVKDAAVVTSGIYERMFREGGRIYHHILDPETGYPAETDLEAVTLRADKGCSAMCDGFSTICIMLGKDDALAFIEHMQEIYPEMGLEAAFIDKNDDIVQTEGMDIVFSEDQP